MKLHLDNYTIEGTPEEIVEYQRLLENKEADKPTFHGVLGSMKLDESSIEEPAKELEQQLESLYSSFHDKFLKSDEAEEPTTDLQVGDSVKVLKDEGGAVGEATVSAILSKDTVKLAGYDSTGYYLERWSHSPHNLEKIDKELPPYEVIQAKAWLDDKSIDQVLEEEKGNCEEEDEPTLEQYFEIIDNKVFRFGIEEGTILKKITTKYNSDNDNKTYITSDGIQQASSFPERDLKQLDAHTFKDRFKFAEEAGVMLTVDTDFAVECEGHEFRVTDKECLSNFEEDEVLTIVEDDGSKAITFENAEGTVQFVLIEDVREVARPNK